MFGFVDEVGGARTASWRGAEQPFRPAIQDVPFFYEFQAVDRFGGLAPVVAYRWTSIPNGESQPVALVESDGNILFRNNGAVGGMIKVQTGSPDGPDEERGGKQCGGHDAQRTVHGGDRTAAGRRRYISLSHSIYVFSRAEDSNEPPSANMIRVEVRVPCVCLERRQALSMRECPGRVEVRSGVALAASACPPISPTVTGASSTVRVRPSCAARGMPTFCLL